MGRRNVNTTKSGKYMNPTDQARKEARKRELKKNKKQRMAVRQAVLKSKDPVQLLDEAAYYDKQEFDPSTVAAAGNGARTGIEASKLSERVIQEKRKKLLETFDRVVAMYRREDPEKATALIKAKYDYEAGRQELILYYEQVKLAERVTADDIPLPPPSESDLLAPTNTSQIPLPSEMPSQILQQQSGDQGTQPVKSILKRAVVPPAPVIGPQVMPIVKRKPPGPPPGPPPDLSDSDDEDDSVPPIPGIDKATINKRIRFADEDATAVKQTEKEVPVVPAAAEIITPFHGALPAIPRLLPPPPRPTIPPPLRHRPPLPPAPGILPPRLASIPLPTASRLPPPPVFQQLNPSVPPQQGVYAAPPSLHKPTVGGVTSEDAAVQSQGSQGATTIEAKPQLKNLIGDATKFVPTAVKVRRTIRDSRGRLVTQGGGQSRSEGSNAAAGGSGLYEHFDHGAAAANAMGDKVNKDDAYDQFMREMEAIL